MKSKKFQAYSEILLMIISTFAIAFFMSPLIPAKASSCCEKTKDGAYCINTDSANCDAAFKTSPTSCETTSYCKLGTCYDSSEGICMENTPQNICEQSGGTWDERSVEELPQCQLGCCILADQAAFVPLVRCKKLSSLYGIGMDYNTDIKSETECILTAQSQDMGACVYEKDFTNTCKFTTRKDCGAEEGIVNGTNITLTGKKFYKDYLCSAEELNTDCARQTTTDCYEGKVYWIDSCGNRENVYSSDKERSWNNGKVAVPSDVCSANSGSDKDCGNCDYLEGSRCAKFEKALGLGKPNFGDYYCKNTKCVDRDGKSRLNGESWCYYDSTTGNGTDPVGSRQFREVCIDGKVYVEPCEDFRNEVCIEGSVDVEGGFNVAACRANRWQDCVAQDEQDDCENIDRRDCSWFPPVPGLTLNSYSGTGTTGSSEGDTFTNPTGETGNGTITGEAVFTNPTSSGTTSSGTVDTSEGVCVPNTPPGLEFWDNGDAVSICGLASFQCTVFYEKKLLGGKKCVANCECLEDDWAQKANKVCTALGDCGGYVNYVGQYTDDGYEWNVDGKDKTFTPNQVNQISSAFTGKFIVSREMIVGNAFLDFVSAGPSQDAQYADQKESKVGTGPSNTQTTLQGGTVEDKKGFWSFLAPITNFFQKDALGLSVGHSLLVGGIAYGIAELAGADNPENIGTSAGAAVFAGEMTYKILGKKEYEILGKTFKGWNVPGAGWIGIGVGTVVFLLLYKTTDQEVVTFECLPWQAPNGGADCEKCNTEDLPCSDYRCKSLGQSCEIVNEGTDQEKCVNINPRDVEPPIITPNEEYLSSGYKYTNVKTSPPGPGFKIEGESQECVKPFTPLQFGISTNEPSQCKIDYNHTLKLDEMSYFMGSINLYLYNHSEQLTLPGPELFENASIVLQNGREWNLFIRCRDKNGNENTAEYNVRFCIDPSPDTTVPQVKATSIANGGSVAANSESANVDFYINEPAECKWDFEDKAYGSMLNNMACANQVHQINSMQLYTCAANLTGIARDGTTYYIRCKDQPGVEENDRNVNSESYEYSLKGSTDLKMQDLQPNETVYSSINPAPIYLSVETLFGSEEGKAICYYSTTGNDADYIKFFETNNIFHKQRQDLTAGDYTYYYKCVDSAGNLVENSTSFTVDIDTSAPVIARVYNEDDLLKIITVRNSECSYSFENCDFLFKEGVEMPYANSTAHVTEWQSDKIYYIKCRDEFVNENADCSMVVKPYDLED